MSGRPDPLQAGARDAAAALARRLDWIYVAAAGIAGLVAVGQLARGRLGVEAIGMPLAIAATALAARRLPAAPRVLLVVLLTPLASLAFLADAVTALLESRATPSEDPRPVAQVVLDWRAAGKRDAVPPTKAWAYLADPLHVGDVPTIPLTGLPHSLEVLCNEGGPWRGYHTDRYGFTNPDPVWDAPAELVLLGDSFTQGFCVAEDESFAARLRAAHPATINFGGGANGPLIELGTLVEFGARAAGHRILWFFYEGNDLGDLLHEAEQPIVRAYLEPGASQHLLERIDAVHAAQRESAERKMMDWFDTPEAPGAWNELLRIAKLGHLRARLGLLRTAPHDYDSLDRAAATELFGRVAERIAEEARRTDASVLLVYLPAREAIGVRGSHPLRQTVLDVARSAGIGVLDLTDAIVRHPDPEQLFSAPRGWSHYSAAGNRIVAEQVLAALSHDDRTDP